MDKTAFLCWFSWWFEQNPLLLHSVFHGIRFKVIKDWLSGDNQFFCFYPLTVYRHEFLISKIYKIL